MATLASIVLRRLDSAYFPSTADGIEPAAIDEIRLQFAVLGYELTPDAIEKLKATSVLAVQEVFEALLELLTESAKRATANTMKSTFSSHRAVAELLAEHEAGGRLKPLQVAVECDVEEIFARLASQPMAYSEQDLLDIMELSEIYPIGDLRAQARENNATLAGLFPEYNWTRGASVTDVLRVATVWSGGDASMTTPVKFKLKRSQRRILLSTLNKIMKKDARSEFDFARNPEAWKRLMKVLHPHETNSYPLVRTIAEELYDGRVISEDTRVESAIRAKDLEAVLIQLKGNPGAFGRRLAELLRKFPHQRAEILEQFEESAGRISSRVLLQMRNHFSGPDVNEVELIPARFKSRTIRNGFIKNRLDGDYSDVVYSILSGLEDKNKGKKIFIEGDETGALTDGVKVMTSNRSVTTGGLTVPAGSRVKVEDGDHLALFMHWRNMDSGSYNDRVDLDLSARFLSEDLSKSEDIAYYRTEGIAKHSGDITNAPNGAEEYITIDTAKAKASGYRYILMSVYNYSGQLISSVPEAYAGVTAVDGFTGTFKSSDVKARFDLASETREVVPFIFDLETNEIIWVDAYFPGIRHSGNLASSNNVGNVLLNMINSPHFSIREFVEKTGGEFTSSKDEADFIINPLKSDQVLQLLN